MSQTYSFTYGWDSANWLPELSFAYVLSATLVVVACVSYVSRKKQLANWRKAAGKVVEVKKEWHADSDGSNWMYAPVIEFTVLEDGSVRRFQRPGWSKPAGCAVGDLTTVIYDPADPSTAMLAGWGPYLLPLIWVLAAAVAALMGAK